MAKAIRVHKTGGPEVLQLEEVSLPAPGPGEILIRNRAIDRAFLPAIDDEERQQRIKGWNKAVKCAYHWEKEE